MRPSGLACVGCASPCASWKRVLNCLSMRSLELILTDLHSREQDNLTLEPQKLKPKNEPLIIEALLKLADEIKNLRTRLDKLEGDAVTAALLGPK